MDAQRCSLHALEANDSPNSSDPEDFFDRQVSKVRNPSVALALSRAASQQMWKSDPNACMVLQNFEHFCVLIRMRTNSLSLDIVATPIWFQAIPAHFVGELRTLAESIRGSILTANPDVRWDSIVGLGEAAKLLKEAVIQPIKYPELFTGTDNTPYSAHAPTFSRSVRFCAIFESARLDTRQALPLGGNVEDSRRNNESALSPGCCFLDAL